jgi:hypothetical protein
VCVLAGCGFLVAATIVVLALVRTRPLHGVVWLLLPAIPVAVAGALWMIWIIEGRRQPAAKRSRVSFLSGHRLFAREAFGDLPRTARVAGLAIALLLVVSSFTAFPGFSGLGHPLPPTRHCKYRVNEQGEPTCTTEATYYLAGRDDQRYVASIFALFYVMSLGTVASDLIRRRRED